MTWTLTRREQQVAFLVVSGLSDKQVARELSLSVGTVKVHVHSILRKTGIKSRYLLLAQLVPAAATR